MTENELVVFVSLLCVLGGISFGICLVSIICACDRREPQVHISDEQAPAPEIQAGVEQAVEVQAGVEQAVEAGVRIVIPSPFENYMIHPYAYDLAVIGITFLVFIIIISRIIRIIRLRSGFGSQPKVGAIIPVVASEGKESIKGEIVESDSGAGLSNSTSADTGKDTMGNDSFSADTGIGTIELNATKVTKSVNSLGLGNANRGPEHTIDPSATKVTMGNKGNPDRSLEYTAKPDENLAEFIVNTLEKIGLTASYPLHASNWVLIGLSGVIWICILYILITRHGGDDDTDGKDDGGISSSKGLVDLLPTKEERKSWDDWWDFLLFRVDN